MQPEFLMNEFLSFLEELSSSTNIPLKVCQKNTDTYYFNFKEDEQDKFKLVSFVENDISIFTYLSFSSSFNLLRYVIEKKYKELFCLKDKIFADIIEGKEKSSEELAKIFPYLDKGCTLFLIMVEGNLVDPLAIIKELYENQNVDCFIYNNAIVLLGSFEESFEHAKSIQDSIMTNLFLECTIFYSDIIKGTESLISEYTKAKECILLKKRFSVNESILCYNKILFEKIIYHISPDLKYNLSKNMAEVFDNFDNEIINTIEQFFKCDLNISDTAKKLYVHRNTLIYRIDKINKETGYDIKNFKDAALFLIIFLIWKESRR